VAAGAPIQLRFRHVEKVQATLAYQQTQVERSRVGAGRVSRVEQVDATRLKASLAGA
jgi:hypothetical protein